MTIFIVCTKAQRDHLVANTPRLDPIPLQNGVDWVLGLACITELELSDWHDYLKALPQREVAPEEFPPPEDPGC